MILRAGEKYILRNKSVEKCLAVWTESAFGYQATMTFWHNNRADYTIDGKFNIDGSESSFDVIAEFNPYVFSPGNPESAPSFYKDGICILARNQFNNPIIWVPAP